MSKILYFLFILVFCMISIADILGNDLPFSSDVEVKFPTETLDDVYYNPFAVSAKGDISINSNLVGAGKKVLLSFRLHDAIRDESKNWVIELEESQASTPIYLFAFNDETKKPLIGKLRLDIVKCNTNTPRRNNKTQVLSSRVYENIIWKCPDVFFTFRLFINPKKKFPINKEFPIFRISDEFVHKDWVVHQSQASNLSNKSKFDYLIYLKTEIMSSAE